MMKYYLIYGVVVLAAVCLMGTQAEETPTVGKENLPMPKVFSFENFKKIFRKEYRTPVEEEAREKIYLARAFKAFLSFIEYKNYRKSYYLKINEMSDWTEEEILWTTNSMTLIRMSGNPRAGSGKSNDIIETPVASFEEVRMKLDEIVDQPEYSKIREELSVSRVKRDTDQLKPNRDSLTLNDLVGSPDRTPEILEKVPSSNPDYEAPELMSFGADAIHDPYMNDNQDFSLIMQKSGIEYLNKLVSHHKESMNDKANLPEKDQSENDILLIDHRQSNCLTGPKNQGQCNAGYIFAVNSLYEFQYCNETGIKTSFSEQYALDCGDRHYLNGCWGGHPADVSEFYAELGIELTSVYPYMGYSYVCPYKLNISPLYMGYHRLSAYKESYFMAIEESSFEKVLENQPIVMSVVVPDYFNMYGGGIDDGANALGQVQTMVIVGMGRENGVEYWLMRNSYGTSWGEYGYYRLNKRASKKLFLEGFGYFLSNKKRKNMFSVKKRSNIPKELLNRRKEVNSGQYIEPNRNTFT